MAFSKLSKDCAKLSLNILVKKETVSGGTATLNAGRAVEMVSIKNLVRESGAKIAGKFYRFDATFTSIYQLRSHLLQPADKKLGIAF